MFEIDSAPWSWRSWTADEREVLRGACKTDIFVQAHAGWRDAAAHNAEAKIWGGRAQVPAGLCQLFGYATARTDAQSRPYCVRNRNLGLAAERCAETIVEHALDRRVEHQDRLDLALSVEHPTAHSTVAVPVVFVHLPPDAPDG